MAPINEKDLESPGYEYLRSYQSMIDLYYKLVALNYQKDFCARYKCPQIHRLYFSIPAKNPAEQQFLYSCLCAWLIKDKCQMNLSLEPEEYDDPDNTIDVIVEAVRLLMNLSEDSSTDRVNPNIGFPLSRLKQGFGPEVIWTMSILADRALEILCNSNSSFGEIRIEFNNKGTLDNTGRQTNIADANSITIGQPVVGGGLTTRPLGSYQIDDSTLMLDTGDEDTVFKDDDVHIIRDEKNGNSEDWYRQVEQARVYLENVDISAGHRSKYDGYDDQRAQTRKFVREIEHFLSNSENILKSTAERVDDQLQRLYKREKAVQVGLSSKFEQFIKIWQTYTSMRSQNDDLVRQVKDRIDKIRSCTTKIRTLKEKTGPYGNELNGEEKLRNLEHEIRDLESDNEELETRPHSGTFAKS